MSITLTAEEQQRFVAAQRAMLSFETEEPRAWERQVCRHLKALLGADRAGFFATTDAPDVEFSEDYPVHVREAYRDYYAERDPGHQLLRAERRAVFTRAMLFDGDISGLLDTECYNDFFIPNGMEDSAGFTLPATDDGDPSPGVLALHRGEFGSDAFARRAPVLLGLLAPSFRHAYLARHQLRRHLTGLHRTIDALGQPAALYDLDGEIVHANPSLRARLSTHPDTEALRQSMDGAVSRSVRAGRSGTSIGDALRGPPHPHDPTAMLLDARTPEPLVLVLLPPSGAGMPSPPTIRERFGLTRRQSEVALLLARRKTNDEVADALGISPHTARRHTEAVMARLAVSSRRDVAAALESASPAHR